MRKQYNMRVRESDLERLNKTVKNFNARLAYATKKADPADALYMPKRITPKQALASIETRAEFNRLIAKLERFNAKSAEIVQTKGGAKTTKWALNEAKREDRRITRENRKRKEEIEKKPPKVGGEEVGNFRPITGETKDVLRTQERNFDNMDQARLDRALRTIDRMIDSSKRREGLEQMRENYIKGLGENGFLDADPELENIIRSVDLETFYETQQVDDTATFQWYKDPQGFQTRLEYMKASWQKAAEGKK